MDYRKHVVEAGLRMMESGLTVCTWGNISARNPKNGRIFLTPSGMAYDVITPEDIVVVDGEGRILEGTRKPTVEMGMHLAIYRLRSDVNAIIHTHPIHSSVFGVLRRDIPVINDEAAQIFGGPVRVTNYALPGTEALAEEAAKAIGEKGSACILANHGAVCVGKDMERAFRVAQVLEMSAEIYYKALAVGTPYEITAEDAAYMKDFMDHKYGQ